MRTAARVAGVGLLVAVLAGAGVLVYASRGRAGEPATQPGPLPTVAVSSGDLTSSVQQPGQLGFTGSYQLIGNRSGMITAVPVAGQVIDRGQPVYWVDGRPVPLLIGSLPVYRALRSGLTGPDVRQFERNLADLGHAPGLTVDDRFTAATATAVKRWQRALGVAESGVLEPGDVVVAPGPVRITSVPPVVGSPAAPGEPVAVATGTGPGVHVDLDLRYRALATAGGAVRIQLFGGREVDGVIGAVGDTATPAGQQAGQQQPQTIGVDIVVPASADLGGVLEGPVTVVFPGETRRGVLSVPIEALTVLPDGGYAVVPAGRQPVPVTTGLITSNRVEITGPGIAEGVLVEVPAL